MKLLTILMENFKSVGKYNNPEFVRDLEHAIESDGSSFNCEYVSSAIKMLEGDKVKIYGFSANENPTSVYFKDDGDDGHHFAVLNNRYIIDPWMYNNFKDYKSGKIFGRSVFDLRNEQDLGDIEFIYGDRKYWTDVTNSTYDFKKLFPKTYKNLLKYSESGQG